MEVLLSICFLMLMEFDGGSKQFFCEYIILILAICFVCGLILSILNCCKDDGDNRVPTGLLVHLIITIINICVLSPCSASMYSFINVLLAIGITICIAIILTIISFTKLDLRTKEESLFLSLVVLVVSFIIYAFTSGDFVVWYILLSLSCFLCFLYLICTYKKHAQVNFRLVKI